MVTIFHVDLDAFFASCEETLNPNLKNKAFVVGGLQSNSVVSTANYLARKLGVKSAMPIFMAKKICPKLVIVKGNYSLYEEISNKFFDLLKEKVTTLIEIASIDECYIDVSNILVNRKITPIALAKEIQKMVLKELKINASIGISNNKFCAKMATDINKPFGITLINCENFKDIIWPMPINEMLGVGQKTIPKLNAIGINTIQDFALFNDDEKLASILGKKWKELKRNTNGQGSDKLDFSQNIPKSLSLSKTLLSATSDEQELTILIKQLNKKLVTKLKYYNLKTKTLSIHYRDSNKKLHNKSLSLESYIESECLILMNLLNIFDTIYADNAFTMLGINFGKLKSVDADECNIFNFTEPVNKKSDEIDHIINAINTKFQKQVLSKAKNKLK